MNVFQNYTRTMLFMIMVGTVSVTYTGWQGWGAWISNGLSGVKQTVITQKQAVVNGFSAVSAYVQSVVTAVTKSLVHITTNMQQVAHAHPYGTYLVIGIILGIYIALHLNKRKRRA